MKRDIPEKVFESYSKEKQKQYIAKLLIQESGAKSVEKPDEPLAIIMAGLPGAGKTEFLDTLHELLTQNNHPNSFVRIDLDQIVTIYPEYSPQSYEKFRSQGNYALARCIDVGMRGNYNMMIDGTFGGNSDSSINNLERLLNSGYKINMFFIYDDPETSWQYTDLREIETKRGISKEGFIRSCQNVPKNLKTAVEKFSNNDKFRLYIVAQKRLRDKNYSVITDINRIDKIINEGYNIDNLRKIL